MRVLTVPEVTDYIKDLIELDPILSQVWIRGEVTNLSRSSAGHMYFCLVSEGVQLNCVLFRGNQVGLLAVPRNGDEVLAHGRVSIYQSRGQYQLIVDNVAPEGIGILQLQFEEIKRRLEAEGLFATDRKRPLPVIPRVIGVVTSETGAVWHDIQNVVARRYPFVELVLAPSSVQGISAAEELTEALRRIQQLDRCDVIIIGRGGGAAEDLACFNDERLARAIYGCRIPVVSAVGHETDTCIADLVADVRAPTPSAAAELCVPNAADLVLAAGQLVVRARTSALQALRSQKDTLASQTVTIGRNHPRSRMADNRQDVDFLSERARCELGDRLEALRDLVRSNAEKATLLNPADVLRRGYAVITTSNGTGPQRVVSASKAAKAAHLTITFADGSVRTTVSNERA